MSDLSGIFGEGCKVVISPDKMRAWIVLAPPARGVAYTAQAVAEWLPQHGVVYGADAAMIQSAVAAGRYDDMLEVARGKAPVAPAGGDFVLRVDQKPFTGLNGASDGSLYYDDLSFLQEVQPGQILADITPPVQPEDGMTVTGEALPPRGGSAGRTLEGSGFALSPDGKSAVAPILAHVNIVNDQLIVTPLKKLAGASEADGEVRFEGNLLVEGDVTAGAKLVAGGSIFITGRAVSAHVEAGNNLLISGGMRSEGGPGTAIAKGNIWGLFFDNCTLSAGGDICANHLSGCGAAAGGRALILGGRAAVAGTNLEAKNGIVAGHLGDTTGVKTAVAAGLDKEFLDNYNALDKKTNRLGVDIQALQQGITAFEKLNRMKPDKGRGDPKYKEMIQKRDQMLSVQKILEGERTRMKRTLEQASGTSIVARDTAWPGLTVTIDTRFLEVKSPLKRPRFRRVQDVIEVTTAGG